jgi:hypothetical protein
MTLVLWFILAISNGKDGERNGFLAKAFGIKVQWDEKNRWVMINTVNLDQG